LPEQRATTSWGAELWRRVRTLWWLKALGNAVFLTLFFYLYLYIQRHPQFEVTQIPATLIDRWIGFQPEVLWIYLSLWVYTALPVALQPDFHRLTRYGWHIGLMCVLALAVFVFWPTSVSGAVGPRDAGGSFEMLYRIDTNGNACPSLHVAAAVFSVLWLRAILRQIRAPAWLGGLNWLWCLAIAYSTMAVKQHLLIDVLAGAALGAVAGGLSLRALAAGRPAEPGRSPVQ